MLSAILLPPPTQSLGTFRVRTDNKNAKGPSSALPPGVVPVEPIGTVTVTDNFYALNVFLNTFLFVTAFVSGTAWTKGAAEYLENRRSAKKMLTFALIMTLLTCGLAIGFGELSRVNRQIQVNYLQDLNL